MWINVSVAGKTVWSLVNVPTWAHYKVLYKCPCLVTLLKCLQPWKIIHCPHPFLIHQQTRVDKDITIFNVVLWYQFLPNIQHRRSGKNWNRCNRPAVVFTERLIILDTDPVARLEVRQTYNTSNIIIILDTDPVARLEVRQTYNISNIILDTDPVARLEVRQTYNISNIIIIIIMLSTWQSSSSSSSSWQLSAPQHCYN